MESKENIVFQKGSKTEPGTLNLSGSLTIQEAERLKEILTQALQKKNKLNVNIENVDYIDLSCIQILLAANKSNKNITILEPVSDAFHKSISDAGFNHLNWISHS